MSALAHSGLDPATGEVVKARRSNDKPSLLWNSSSGASRRRVYRWIKCSSATSIARPLICSPPSTLSTPTSSPKILRPEFLLTCRRGPDISTSRSIASPRSWTKIKGDRFVLSDLRSASKAGSMGRLSRRSQDVAARTGTGRRLRRQYPLQEPVARWLDPFAIRLARREIRCPLAHSQAAPYGAGEGPIRDSARL